jgi:hypothetical protein
MKIQCIVAISLCAAVRLASAQEATPGVVRSSRPAPAPRPAVAAAPATVAPQARAQASFAPSVVGSHGLGLGNPTTYRPAQTFTPRQFQPTTTLPNYHRDWNRPSNTVATGVTPRVGSVPQQNVATNADVRAWNPNANARRWNGRVTPNSAIVGNGAQNWTNGTTNNWRARNNNNFANWQDARRGYDHQRHDRDWWRRHHDRIIFVNNGYYYWDAGWWYPAWGYDPAAEFYAYDGPIYGYDGLPPDQVIATVQTALQQQGYYQGMIDGQLGPMTRQAVAAWQRDHGLAITAAIDYPTLASLGLS